MLPFLDEVEEPEPAIGVALRDRDHEAEVRLDQPALALLRLRFAAPDDAQHVAQHLRRHADVLGGLLDAAARLPDDLARLEHLGGRRVEEAARRLARVLLLGADAARVPDHLGAGVAQAILEPADGELVAVDGAVRFLQRLDQARHVLRADLGLQQRLANALLDDLEPLGDRRLASLRRARLASLGHELVLLAHEPAQLRHLLQEAIGPLVFSRTGLARLGGLAGGRLVVAEDVPRLDLTVLQTIGETEHVLHRQVEREDRLAHLALAGLDLLRDGDFLLAREEGNAAHLLEVHPHRIGGLAGCALDLLGLGGLLGPGVGLGRLLRRILGEGRLLDALDLDVHVAEQRDDLVELFGAGRLDGCFARLVDRGGRLPGRRPRVPDAGLLLGGSFFHAPHACGGRAGVHQHAQFEIEREPLDDVETGHTPDHR